MKLLNLLKFKHFKTGRNNVLNSNNFIFKQSKFSFCQTNTSQLDLDTYLKEVDSILNSIYEQIDENEFEMTENIIFVDGVLKVTFSNNKNYVINIQRPNKQIWLSSPFSGPQRFEFDTSDKKWKNIRNKKSLLDILNEELNQLLKDNNISSNITLI